MSTTLLSENKYSDIYEHDEFVRTHQNGEIIALFGKLSREELIELNQKVSIAGRLLKIRRFGKKLIFAVLAGETGSVQLKIDDASEFTNLNNGDIIGVLGVVCKTKTGELSISVNSFTLLSKCLKPLPDTYHGFTNVEERYRKRYLDFLINPQNREALYIQHKLLFALRTFLNNKGYIEVETPILVAEASGAQAKPFITHHNKLHEDFYLRIAPEIPLKKLLIGGFEQVYEIGRVFRNEGIDSSHNPEFTTLEVYCAFKNSEYMMNLTEEIFHHLADVLIPQQKEIKFNGHVIKLHQSFERITMTEAVRQHAKVDFNLITNNEQAYATAKKHNVFLEPFQNTVGHILAAFFEKFVEQHLIQPTFIYEYPTVISPLAKQKKGKPQFTERFELFLAGGIEYANGYNELNNPHEQRKRFEQQKKEKEETGNEEIAGYDNEFVEALEYALAPATGLGVGINRLTCLFLQQERINIKEVIAFPQLKNKTEKEEK